MILLWRATYYLLRTIHIIVIFLRHPVFQKPWNTPASPPRTHYTYVQSSRKVRCRKGDVVVSVRPPRKQRPTENQQKPPTHSLSEDCWVFDVRTPAPAQEFISSYILSTKVRANSAVAAFVTSTAGLQQYSQFWLTQQCNLV